MNFISFYFIICLNISSCLTASVENSFIQRIFRRQAQSCNNNGDFACVSGGCISRYDVCDGVKDCQDGSDETATSCRQINLYTSTCSPKFFKCQYGACVSLTERCDGKWDCSDHSDEVGCPGQSLTVFKPDQSFGPMTACNSVRGENKYSQCGNGQCIDYYNLCDGSVDCSDRSDESEQVCYSLFRGRCGADEFRCAYGACLQPSKRCDRKTDCWDGSDETGCPYYNTPATPPLQLTTTTSTSRPSGRPCSLPPYAENRKFEKWNCPGCVLYPGQTLGDQQLIVASCDSGHQLGQDKTQVIASCQDGHWFPEIPNCQKLCPQLFSDTLDLLCWQGPTEGCKKPMLPGTRVEYKCKQFYQGNFGFRLNEIRCDSSGQWSGPLPACISKCGQANLGGNVQPTIVGGTVSKAGTFPWHAALFQYKNEVWEPVCGGTLINTHTILTAAHCVTARGGLEPPPLRTDEIMVVLGKYYRDYDRNEGTETRIRVKEVLKHKNYRGEQQRYAQDIALLVLEQDVIINSYVMPACVDFDLQYEQQIFQDKNILGYIAGWGNTEDCSAGTICSSASPVLKYTQVPVITNEECYRATQPFRPSVQSILTIDKFCAGNGNVSLVQPGDSGGGLTFVFNNVHFVYGIVSVKLQLEISDKRLYSFSAFTSVPDHMKWLKDQLV